MTTPELNSIKEVRMSQKRLEAGGFKLVEKIPMARLVDGENFAGEIEFCYEVWGREGELVKKQMNRKWVGGGHG
jgi:hypothetical protein